MKRLAVALALVCLSGVAFAGTVSFVGQGFIPDPNQEVTVYVQTDKPLWGMWLYATVAGDVTITDAIDWEDCNDYGWDPGWSGVPELSADGHTIGFGGLKLTSDANGVVGYFKFIYHSGQVTISMVGDAVDGDWNMVPVSTGTLVFGQSQQTTQVFARSALRSFRVAALSQASTSVAQTTTIVADTPPDPYAEFQKYMHPGGGSGTGTLMMAALSGPMTYDANTVLTENTVWDHDVTLNGPLYVEGCELVVMPGVTVWNEGGSGGITVRNNGVIIASGTNQNKVGFAANTQNYDFAVKIESTASPACRIDNAVIMFAGKGVWIENRRLESPIQQMTIARCIDGVYQEGPNLTDIINNEMIQCVWSGIEVYLADKEDPNGTCSAGTFINIEHNSVVGFYTDYESPQFYGITIHGSPDPNKAGYVAIADNLIAGSSNYAINMGDGSIVCQGRKNNGYYDNWYIDTGDPWGDINPKVTWECPFVDGIRIWPYMLKRNCVFVDGGFKAVEQLDYLIGQSTYMGIPDVNAADIGIHYNLEGFVNAGINPLTADINADLGVDANDMRLLACHWLEDGNSPGYDPKANLCGNSRVDMRDLAKLAGQWKQRTLAFPPDAAPSFDQGPNSLSGEVTLTIPVPDFVYKAYVLLDGKTVGDITAGGSDPNTLVLDTRLLANGAHVMKTVYLCNDGRVFVTTPVQVTLTNSLSMMVMPQSIEAGRDTCAYGISDPNSSWSVSVRDIGDETVFSQTCQGGVKVVVPASVVSDIHNLFTLTVSQPQSGGLLFMSAGGSEFEMLMARKFDPTDPAFAGAGMVISIGSKDVLSKKNAYKTGMVKAKIKAAVSRGLDPIVLPYEQCTFENLQAALGMPGVLLWDHTAGGRQSESGHPRLSVEIKGSRIFSYLAKDYLDPNPPGYKKLGRPAESQHTVTELDIVGIENNRRSCRLNWVSFTADWSFLGYDDQPGEFASWMGIYQTEPGFPPEKVFIGWRTRYFDDSANDGYPLLLFDTEFWKALGQGRTIIEAQKAGFEENGFDGATIDRVQRSWRYYGPDMYATELSRTLK
jgi:hypothetical protein